MHHRVGSNLVRQDRWHIVRAIDWAVAGRNSRASSAVLSNVGARLAEFLQGAFVVAKHNVLCGVVNLGSINMLIKSTDSVSSTTGILLEPNEGVSKSNG